MIITKFASLYDTKEDVHILHGSWQQLCQWLEKPAMVSDYTWAEFNALPEDSSKFTDYDWQIRRDTQESVKTSAGGAVYGRMVGSVGRSKENFPTRSAISLDYEHCSADIYDRVKNALDGYSYAYHTTCKHHPPDDYRLRVIVPFATDVRWELHSIVAVDIANKIGVQGIDRSCVQPYRMMLFCVLLKGNEYSYHYKIDTMLDVEKYLMDKYGTLDIKELTEKAGINWDDWPLPDMEKLTRKKKVVSCGGREIEYEVKRSYNAKPGDVISCFNDVVACWEILDTLPDYSRSGRDRYKYDLANSRGGVSVSLDGRWTKSWHENSGDPIHDERGYWSAFDLFVRFKCDKKLSFKQKLNKAHDYALNNHREKYGKKFYGEAVWEFYKKE